MKIISVAIDKIKPYSKNPRINDAAVQQVAQSLKAYGFQQPIVVDKKYVVVVGHTRLLAAKELGMDKVPVTVADKLTPKQIKAYRIADNKTNEFSTWDFDLLKDELDGLDNLFTGFDDDELDELLGDVSDVGFPNLVDGDKQPFQQMAFSLHDDQVELVKEAIVEAKLDSKHKSKLNDNSNANAITFICKEFLK